MIIFTTRRGKKVHSNHQGNERKKEEDKTRYIIELSNF